MKKMNLMIAGVLMVSGLQAFAVGKHDGSDIPACAGVTDKCLAAQVTSVDSKTGKTMTGYIAGEPKRDGHGLWADCVEKLAKGQPVDGVTGVTADAAKACLAGERAAHSTKK